MIAKLDHIDKQIVDLLTVDGRMSCADIAREVGGITERTVRYRLERLITEKVITISAIVDPKALGCWPYIRRAPYHHFYRSFGNQG
jgi:DNA-binding Lrp family transcriptional regulator